MTSTLGRLPSGYDAGYGEMLASRIRASIVGFLQGDGWATRITIRVGRNTATNAAVKLAVYESTTSVIGALKYQTASLPVTTLMLDRMSGADVGAAITGLPINAKQNYALAVEALISSIAYGQDNSGWPMHFDNAATFDNPYGADSVSAQGKISIQLLVEPNRQPVATILSPSNGTTISDTTPDITIGFSDPDESRGDYFLGYLIELWDAQNTTRLQTSGYTATDAGEQTAKQAAHTLTTLTPGLVYTVRGYVYDHHELVSQVAQTTFTLNAGGAFTNMHINSVAGVDTNGYSIVDAVTDPSLTVTWTHSGGTALAEIRLKIKYLATGAEYRATRTWTTSQAAGATFDIIFTDGAPDWTALARQADAIYYEVQGVDALGGVTPWQPGSPFIVNPRPVVSATISPVDGSITSTPVTFAVSITDANDSPSNVDVIITGDAPVGETDILATMTYVGGTTYEYDIPDANMNTLGDYEWQVLVYDQWMSFFDGVISPNATVELVTAPAILITNPDDDEVITTATPTVTWTLDRTQARRRITIWNPDLVHRVDWHNSASLSYAVPAALLRNNSWYDIMIEVEAADGLLATSHTQFRVQYTQPAAMTNVAIATIESNDRDLETITVIGQKPNIRIVWDRVSTGTVSVDDWRGYLVRRTDEAGVQEQWQVVSRDQTQFTDTTPNHLISYRYDVSYMKSINSGRDVIESVPVELHASVAIMHTTITSDNPDEPAVTLHYWEGRDVDTDTDVTVIPGWGELPIVFKGIRRGRTISGTFEVFDDDSGEDRYSALDTIALMQRMLQPVRDPVTNRLRPQPYNWRDPQNAMRGSLTRFSKSDQHDDYHAIFDAEFVEHE